LDIGLVPYDIVLIVQGRIYTLGPGLGAPSDKGKIKYRIEIFLKKNDRFVVNQTGVTLAYAGTDPRGA